MKYLKKLLLLVVSVSMLTAGAYSVFEFGAETGRRKAQDEFINKLIMFEYQTTIANFRHCTATVHGALLSRVIGMDRSSDFNLLFAIYSEHCRELLDHSSEIIPGYEEEQDRRTAWVLFWWEGYLRQADEILAHADRIHFGSGEVNKSFMKDLETINVLRRKLEMKAQEAVLDVW